MSWVRFETDPIGWGWLARRASGLSVPLPGRDEFRY